MSSAKDGGNLLRAACSALGLTTASDIAAAEAVVSVIQRAGSSETKGGDGEGDGEGDGNQDPSQQRGRNWTLDILVAVVLVRLVRIGEHDKTGGKSCGYEVLTTKSQRHSTNDSQNGAQPSTQHHGTRKGFASGVGKNADAKIPSGSAGVLGVMAMNENAPNNFQVPVGTSTQDAQKVGGNRQNKKNTGTHQEPLAGEESCLIPYVCWNVAKFLSSALPQSGALGLNDEISAADVLVACAHAIKNAAVSDDAVSPLLSKLCAVIVVPKEVESSASTTRDRLRGNLQACGGWIVSTLWVLLEGAIELCETSADFEFIWERCLRDSGKVAETVFAVPKASSQRQIAKESAWLLLALVVTRATREQEETEDTHERIKDRDVPHSLIFPKALSRRHQRRQKGCLTAAACIAVLLESAFQSQLNSKRQRDEDETVKDSCGGEEPAKKRGRGEDDLEPPALESSPTSASGVRYGRRSIEAEAIAALKMMVSGGASSASMTPDQFDVSTSIRNILNELRNYVGPSEDGKLIGEDELRLEMEQVAEVALELCLTTPDTPEPVSGLQRFTAFPVSSVLARGSSATDEKALDETSMPSSSKLIPYLSTNEARTTNNAVMRQNFRVLRSQALRELQKTLSARLINPSAARSFDAPLVARRVYLRFLSAELRGHERVRASLARCKEEGPKRCLILKDSKGSETIVSSLAATRSDVTPMDVDENEVRQQRWSAFSEAPQAFKMELNEWTGALIACVNASDTVKPSPRLLSYLDSCGIGAQTHGSSLNRKRALSTVIVPMLNQILKRLDAAASSQPFPLPNNPYDDADMLSTDPSVEPPSVGNDGGLESRRNNAGAVSAEGAVTSDEYRRALVFLYYHALEGVLRFETSRTKSVSHQKLVFNGGFHRAVLSLCHVCLLRGMGSAPFGEPVCKSDPPSFLALMNSTPQDFVKVSETFMRGLGQHANVASSSVRFGGMPADLRRHIRETEEMIMESTLWEANASPSGIAASRSVRKTIDELQRLGIDSSGERYWPPEVLRPGPDEESGYDNEEYDKCGRNGYGPSQVEGSVRRNPDYAFVTYILRRLLPIVSHRVSILCSELGIPAHYPLANQIWYALRYLFRHHIDLLYDRHVDQLVLCAVYGVGKIMKYEPELSFARIIEVYTRLNKNRVGEKSCQRIIRHVKLNTEFEETINNPGQVRKTKKKKKFGNIIQLYNQIFVPAVKQHLLYSSSLKEGTSELKRCMAEQVAMETIQTADDAVIMADRVARDGVPMPSVGQCEQVQKVDQRAGIRVRDSNLFLSLPANPMVRTSTPKREAASLTLRTRALYEFGRSLHSDLTLINKTALCEEKA